MTAACFATKLLLFKKMSKWCLKNVYLQLQKYSIPYIS